MDSVACRVVAPKGSFVLSLRCFAGLVSFCMVLGPSVAQGQNFPNKPIRIVTSSAGGGGDIAARLIGQGLSGIWGQQVIVDNRGGVLPGQIVAAASPDGYNLLLFSGALWIGPLLQKTPYDPIADFSPITITDRTPCIIVVHPSVAANSVKELIALAKAKPGGLSYGSGTPGAVTHVAGELFKSMTAVNILHVPYKNAPPAIIDLIGGQIQVMFATASSVSQHVKSGKLRGLAVTTARPSELVPGLPTVAASGVPGYEAASINAVFGPAKTSAALVSHLNGAITRVLSQPELKEKFFAMGVETVGSSPVQLAALVKSEMVTLGKIFKDLNIRLD